MTLMSSKKYSDLGSPEVHQRHAVMIEGGTVPRARVMDQTLIDRYLIDGLLTLQEHQAGEYLLSQAAKAGIFTKPLRGGAGESNPDSMASEPFTATAGRWPSSEAVRSISVLSRMW